MSALWTAVKRLALAAWRPVGAGWRWLHALWRRSIQLRVVATTLLGSGVVVVALGLLLMNQVTRGLVDEHRKSSVQEVETGQRYAEQQLETLGGPNDPSLDGTLRAVVANLSDRGGRAGRFAVAIASDNVRLPPLYVAQYDPDSVQIPSQLADLIGSDQVLGYQYVRTTVDFTDDQAKPRPFLVVGTPLDSAAGQFELYYFFPLDDQVNSVNLVKNALFGMGALLVVLLGILAWLVTRQVVTPVRLAARTAERLSAGLLEERMRVHGEDDLARLAHSFNQMAANLQRQIVRLENLSRLQRRFTSDVSHELRTPLTTIRMAADVLHSQREYFNPEVARSSELLATEVDRFEMLLADLLEVSRYDSGAAVLEPESTDMGVLISRVADGFTTLANKCRVDLRLVLPDPPVIADVDPRRVQRILRNLLGNAIEYGAGLPDQPRKPVVVTLAADGRLLAITVRDYGPGFKSGDTEAVFNRFWRADPSRARHTGGTGLGLSIAREDARLHGGLLQAWTEQRGGAQFRLVLPLRTRDQLAEPLDAAHLDNVPLPLRPKDAGVSGPVVVGQVGER